MRGATAAEVDGISPRYLATAALDALGCDGARDPRPHARPAVDDRLLRNSEQSVGGMGTFGAPTLFVDDRFISARTACATSKRRSELLHRMTQSLAVTPK
jgi:2-hydroxychromene-2-carboxylate isomerase